MTLIDASALLAFLQDEGGSDRVEEALEAGALCTAVNWSEVAQKVRAAGRDWDLARALLLSFELQIEAVTFDDGELAAALWRAGSGLSLADRICIAVGRRLQADILTADRSWGTEPPITQIR